jgi:hypothetical protein
MARPLPEETEHWEDPIVAEVRRVRGDLFAAAGYDLEEFCKRLREQQQREGRAVVTLPPRSSERPGVKRARLRQTKRIRPPVPRKRRG